MSRKVKVSERRGCLRYWKWWLGGFIALAVLGALFPPEEDAPADSVSVVASETATITDTPTDGPTPTPSETLVPSETPTATASATITNTPAPTATATTNPTPLPTATLTITSTALPSSTPSPLEVSLESVEGVQDIVFVTVRNGTAYIETFVDDGFSNQEVAEQLLEVVQTTETSITFFSAILDDSNNATDYTWNGEEWSSTSLGFTAASTPNFESGDDLEIVAEDIIERETAGQIVSLTVNSMVPAVVSRYTMPQGFSGYNVNATHSEMANIVCDLRGAFPDYRIILDAVIDVVDGFGNESQRSGITVTFEPETVNQINCENVFNVNVPAVADDYFIDRLLDE